MNKIRLKISKTVNVLVVGDVMLDEYWVGEVTRISPEAPVPILKANEVEYRAGGASNVALNLNSLGAQVSLFGIIGSDQSGKTLSKLIDDSDIKNHT